jgi:zinc-finger of transposase IS204/IS1001/IS1096/IS1165
MHVLDVATGEDGSVLLEVESDDVLTGCPDCGVVAIGHGRRVQLLHDAPCFGRPVRVRWRKRIWRCPEPACARRTWTEVQPYAIAPKQFDPVNRDLEIRDLYNMEDAFHLADGYEGAYRARLNANLAFWDGLDGKTDWPTDGNGTHPLTDLVLADYLVVDPSKPYAEQGSFLEIERATREGRPHETCGGRAPNDDVIDTIFTLLINAGNGPVIRDGVDQSTRPASRGFPYLSPANPDPPEPPEHH